MKMRSLLVSRLLLLVLVPILAEAISVSRVGNNVTLTGCQYNIYHNGTQLDQQSYNLIVNNTTEGVYGCGVDANNVLGGTITVLRQFVQNDIVVPKTFVWGQRQVLDCTGYVRGNYHQGYKVAWLLDGRQRCIKGSACESKNFNINPDNFSLSFYYYPTFTTYECIIEPNLAGSLTNATMVASYTLSPSNNDHTQTQFIDNLKSVLVENGTNRVKFSCSASVQSNASINFEASDLFDNSSISPADCGVTNDKPTIRSCIKTLHGMNVMIMCNYSTSYEVHCTFSWNLININKSRVYSVACHVNDGTTEASTRTELIVGECSSPCNSGLMWCTGSGSNECCSAFAANGQCISTTDCTSSSGSNYMYVATETNNFTCTCNLTCPSGYTVNSNCTGCDLPICDAYSPCMNGGQCIQYSPPDNYTCNCTGTGHQGVNCTACFKESVRLVGGSNSLEGRVEVCRSGAWGTLCDDSWDNRDAGVVCRQLGYGSGTALSGAYFGQGNGSIFMNSVHCTGLEFFLTNCSHTTNHNCDHSEDAGVRCSHTCFKESVRLVGGSNSLEGGVEVCRDGSWGTVCDDSWDNMDATVVCRQLGYESGTALNNAYFGQGNGSIFMDDVGCTGYELFLTNCSHTTNHNCDHSEDAGVRCSHSSCEVSNCSRCQLFYSSCCTECQLGYEMNDCKCEAADSSSVKISVNSVTSLPSTQAPQLLSLTLMIVAPVVFVLVLCVCIIIVFVIVIIVRRNRNKKLVNLDLRCVDDSGIPLDLNSACQIHQQKDETSSDDTVMKQLLIKYLIASSQIDVQETIGQGEFGIVYKATMKENQREIALKTLKGAFSKSDVNSLLEECLLMSNFDNPNVLSLIGVCADLGSAPGIIMPYMSRGSLLSYLQKEKSHLIVEATSEESTVLNVRKQLLSVCLQVANGMKYLASQRFIHRDLAARNCLIADNGVIKVADFGLSKEVYTKNYFNQFKESKSVKLAVKWMALESLHYGIFSEKSDVWSYGILCWEVFSAGKIPYPGMDPIGLVELLDGGQRLSCPHNEACSEDIYSMMEQCWCESPDDRPLFNDLVASVNALIMPLAPYLIVSNDSTFQLNHNHIYY